jgi:hypothetical protein
VADGADEATVTDGAVVAADGPLIPGETGGAFPHAATTTAIAMQATGTRPLIVRMTGSPPGTAITVAVDRRGAVSVPHRGNVWRGALLP